MLGSWPRTCNQPCVVALLDARFSCLDPSVLRLFMVIIVGMSEHNLLNRPMFIVFNAAFYAVSWLDPRQSETRCPVEASQQATEIQKIKGKVRALDPNLVHLVVE